jgi:hypothetical protein
MKSNISCILMLALVSVWTTELHAQARADLKKMTWLVGSWKGLASNQPFYEAWRQSSATQLTQYGIKINSTDTVVSEIGKIEIKGNMATYGDEQHSWTLAHLTNDEMTFSNDKINFPNVITWRRMQDGHWYCLLKNQTQKAEYDIKPAPALDAAVDRWIVKNKKP